MGSSVVIGELNQPYCIIYGDKMALKEEPYRLLVQHVSLIKTSAQTLQKVGVAYTAGNYQKARELSEEISKIQQEANTISKNVVAKIPKSIFMAVSRHNILLLLRGLDKLVHNIDYGVTLLLARESQMTKDQSQKINEHFQAVVGGINALDDAVLGVYEILKGKKDKKDIEGIVSMVQEVIQYEREADVIHTDLIRMLYGSEDIMEDFAIIHLLRAMNHLDQIVNLAERTAIRLASILTS